MTKRSSEEGFGIVVIALLFTAFAVVAAAALDRSTVQTEMNRQKQAEAQLSRLSVSLAKYARYHQHRLPCPASWLRGVTDGAFGSAEAPVCKGNTAETGTNGYVSTGPSDKLLIGMVPVRELVPYGINFDDAFDPWGSRILYAVHRDVTQTATNAEVSAASTAQRANVYDYQTGEVIAPAPDTVVISLGRDRMGARLRNQGSLASPSINCALDGNRRSINCDNDRNFARGPLITTGRADNTTYFDDSISTLRYTP